MHQLWCEVFLQPHMLLPSGFSVVFWSFRLLCTKKYVLCIHQQSHIAHYLPSQTLKWGKIMGMKRHASRSVCLWTRAHRWTLEAQMHCCAAYNMYTHVDSCGIGSIVSIRFSKIHDTHNTWELLIYHLFLWPILMLKLKINAWIFKSLGNVSNFNSILLSLCPNLLFSSIMLASRPRKNSVNVISNKSCK